MYKRTGVVILALGLPACGGQDRGDVPDTMVLTNVSVVDLESAAVMPSRSIVISGNKIVSIGPAAVSVPAGSRVVDGSGRFVIPGLWDSHTHVIDPDIPGTLDVVLPLLVANGVTGIRDLGSSSLDSILQLRDEIRSGARLGPRVHMAGKVLDGVPVVFPPDAIAVTTPTEAIAVVDSLARRGVDFIKAYEMLEREVFTAVMEAAKERGLPVAAHVPLVLDAAEASAAGVTSFEHLRNLELACSSRADSLRDARTVTLARAAALPDTGGLAFQWSGGYGPGATVRSGIHTDQRPIARATLDTGRCGALIERLVREETWQVPTLFMQLMTPNRLDTTATVRATAKYIPSAVRTLWEENSARAASTGDAFANSQAQAEWYVSLVSELNDAGAGILAGTDISNPWMVPGFSLHEELDQLAVAGLSPVEALKTATVNPARYLNASDSLGAVAPGFVADLVLLDANPLASVSNVRSIHAVVLNGRYLSRTDLDELLRGAERAANPTR